MKTLRIWLRACAYTLRELCRRPLLPAGLALLCLLLPLGIGPAAESALSEGVSFGGLTLAVTGPEGDRTPALLEQALGSMRDVSQYCRFAAMDEAAARDALAAGELTAVLCLPENFVEGVMDGSNPDLLLILPPDRPLEALLTLWVGQSAADLLAAVQEGVYAVLEQYRASPPEGLSWDRAVAEINLRYVSWTLGRQELFQVRELSAVGALPVERHYALSLLAYLGLAAAPLFSGVYSAGRLRAWRRLRCLGRGSVFLYTQTLAACAALLFLLLAGPALLLGGGDPAAALAAAAGMALLCALFGGLCCLLSAGAAGCGALAFALALVFLFLAGGILPPVLLPETLRELSWLSPVSWLRALAALPAGFPAERRCLWAAALAAPALAALSLALVRRRSLRQEAL